MSTKYFDKNPALEAVKKDGFFLKFASEEIRNDKEILLEAVRRDGNTLEYASDEIKDDKQVVIEAVKQNVSAFQFASNELRNEKDVILEVVRRDANFARNLFQSEAIKKVRIRDNYMSAVDMKDILIEAVRKDGNILKYAGWSMSEIWDEKEVLVKEVVLEAVKQNGASSVSSRFLRSDKEVVLEAVKQNGSSLQFVDEYLRSNVKFVLEAVKHNASSLEFVHQKLRNLKEFNMVAVKRSESALKYVNQRFKNDKEVVLRAVKHYGDSLEFASQELRRDREVVLEAVKQNGPSLRFASEKLRNDKEVVLKAVKRIGSSFEYASQRLKNDREFVLDLLKTARRFGAFSLKFVGQKLKSDREVVLESVKNDGRALSLAGKEFLNDRGVVLEASKSFGSALLYSDELKNDKDFVLEVVRRNGKCLRHTSFENDKEVVMEAVKENGYSLKFASEELKNDKVIVLEAVKICGPSLKFASKELQNDKEVVLLSVKNDGSSLKFVSEELRNDKIVALEAVKQNGRSLENVSEERRNDKQVVLEAVKKNGRSLEYASEELQQDEELLHISGIHKEIWNLSMMIRKDQEILERFLSQKGKVAPDSEERQKLETLIDLLIQRSDLEFEMGWWEDCFVNKLLSLQLSKLSEKTLGIKELVSSKLLSSLEEIVKKEFSLNLHQNVLSVVGKQLWSFLCEFSWMESEESKVGNERVFVNEWSENMTSKMKKELANNLRTKLDEFLSTRFSSVELLKELYFEQVQASIFKRIQQVKRIVVHELPDESKEEFETVCSTRFIRHCELKFGNFQDERNEFKNILLDQGVISSIFEEKMSMLKCLDFSKVTHFRQYYEKALSLKYFGLTDSEHENFGQKISLCGYGMVFGEFPGGLILGRGIKFRRLYYGTFSKIGKRHGEKCKEYSSKDGSLVFEGSFKNGKREGKGIEYVVYNSGVPVQVFEGNYRNGKRHGRGESFEKGIVVRGTWCNGVLDKSTIFQFECPIFRYGKVKSFLNDSQKVGKGAFGVIYKAKSSTFKSKGRKMERQVAVKILDRPSCSMEHRIMVRMIRRGIGLCYSLKCKHILESYGIILGTGHRGEIGYVMKLCEVSVDKVIEQGKITLEKKIRILKETAIGIKALHDKCLIHRDLKWGNVLLDFDGVVKITDFDTVKEDEIQWRLKTLSQSARVGTPGFRPPEVITGKKYTFKCDVYAFGLMIYALLFEKNFPYITRSHCSCGVKMTQIVRNDQLEKHIYDCNLRPLMNPNEVNKFPSFLIDLMVQCWDRSAFNRPSLEDIVFMFKIQDRRKVYKLSFQFPLHPGVKVQKMLFIKPFSIDKIIDWIEKKFERPFEEDEDENVEETEGEESEVELKRTKVLRLEHSILGTIHSDEDLIKIFEHEEFPCLKVTLNFIDESFVIDSIDQKISFKEYQKVKKEKEELEEEVKVIRKEKTEVLEVLSKKVENGESERRKLREEIKTLKAEIEKLRKDND